MDINFHDLPYAAVVASLSGCSSVYAAAAFTPMIKLPLTPTDVAMVSTAIWVAGAAAMDIAQRATDFRWTTTCAVAFGALAGTALAHEYVKNDPVVTRPCQTYILLGQRETHSESLQRVVESHGFYLSKPIALT